MESERVRLNIDFTERKYVIAHIIGIEQGVYLSEKQAEMVIKANNNPETRNNFLKVGSVVFKPSSVSSMEEKKEQTCYLPIYLQNRLKAEEKQLLTGGKKDEK